MCWFPVDTQRRFNVDAIWHKHTQTICQLLLTIDLGLRPAILLKKRLQHGSFPVNMAKFLRTPILKNTREWLLLTIAWVQGRETTRQHNFLVYSIFDVNENPTQSSE